MSAIYSDIKLYPEQEVGSKFETENFPDGDVHRINADGCLEKMSADYEIVGGDSAHSFYRILPESIEWKALTDYTGLVILKDATHTFILSVSKGYLKKTTTLESLIPKT